MSIAADEMNPSGPGCGAGSENVGAVFFTYGKICVQQLANHQPNYQTWAGR